MERYGQIDVNLETETLSWNGVEIPPEVCSDIYLAYERMCTARYIMDENPDITEEAAWDYANDARDLMDDYGVSEDEAIREVLNGDSGDDYGDDFNFDDGDDF